MSGILDDLTNWHDPEPQPRRLSPEVRREYDRLSYKRRKKERLERVSLGLCAICGAPAAKREGGRQLKMCERCLERDRRWHQKYRKSTTCRSCKVRTKEPGTDSCKVCALKQRVIEAKQRIARRGAKDEST